MSLISKAIGRYWIFGIGVLELLFCIGWNIFAYKYVVWVLSSFSTFLLNDVGCFTLKIQ